MPGHIIFDCDGVLVDSEPLSTAIDREMLAEHGIRYSLEEMTAVTVGYSMAHFIARIEARHAIRLRPDFAEEKDRRLIERYETELKPIDGVFEVLAAIDLPRSIASNSPRARVAQALRVTGLGRHFNGAIHAIEDVVHGKPAPDLYLRAAAMAGIAPRDCLAVEDSVAGVTSAAAAGCTVIGFTGSNHDRNHGEALRRAGAHLLIARMTELEEAMTALV
jgi:HAD superfamily hydrolase (TIGR01509 family)